MAQTCMAASGTGSQVFIDNVTKDRNGPMNFEVCMETLSAWIQSDVSEILRQRPWHFLTYTMRTCLFLF